MQISKFDMTMPTVGKAVLLATPTTAKPSLASRQANSPGKSPSPLPHHTGLSHTQHPPSEKKTWMGKGWRREERGFGLSLPTRYYPGEKRGKGVLPPSFYAVGGFPHEVFPHVHFLNCFEKLQRRKFGFSGGNRLVGIFFQNLGKFPTRGSFSHK